MARNSINHGLPNLDRFLEGREKKFVTYAEGCDMYGIPYYSFVRLAKEAGANITLRKNAIVDVDMIEKYLEEHPETQDRVNSVRR